MFLGFEINRVFEKLFSSANVRQERHLQRVASEEHRMPLMQIVEKRVSQRQRVQNTGRERETVSVASRMVLASEVGPPPLTPATWHKA